MQNGDVCVHILVHLGQYSVAHWGVRYLKVIFNLRLKSYGVEE